MTGRERLLKVLYHKQPDCIPVVLYKPSQYWLNNYFGNKDSLSAQRELGFDVMYHIGWPIEAESSEDWQSDNETMTKGIINEGMAGEVRTPLGILRQQIKNVGETSWTEEYTIKTKDDIKLLKYRPKQKINLKFIKESINIVGDSGIVIGSVLGVWHEACTLVGTEKLIFECYDNPEWVKELCSILCEYSLAYCSQLIGSYLDLMEVIESYVSTSILNPEIYKEFVLPYDKKIVKTILSCGIPVTYHACGKVKNLIPLILETGTTVLETLAPPQMSGDVELSWVKKNYGKRLILLGGLDMVNSLSRGNPSDVENEVKRCINDAGYGGGYILANTDPFFDVSLDNIKTMISTARKYGIYTEEEGGM